MWLIQTYEKVRKFLFVEQYVCVEGEVQRIVLTYL